MNSDPGNRPPQEPPPASLFAQNDTYGTHQLRLADAWWATDTLGDRQRTTAVQEAVQVLPAEQREAVVLRLWGGLTFAEAAQPAAATSD